MSFDRLWGGLQDGVRGLRRRSRSRSRPSTPDPSVPSTPLSPTSSLNISLSSSRNSTSNASPIGANKSGPGPSAQTPIIPSVQITTPTVNVITPNVPGTNSQNIVPISTKKSLWEEAIEKLDPEDRSAFDFDNPNKLGTLSEVIKAVEVKREECIKKQWKFHKKNGEVVFLRDYAERLLVHLNKYATIGDMIAKHTPNSGVAIAWTGFRFLLQTASNDIETMANIFTALDHITQTLSRCAIYESLHIRSFGQLESVKALVTALPDLYASILAYLCSSKHYFCRNTAVRILDGGLSPYIETFQPLMEQIKNQETRVEKDARVAAEECQAPVSPRYRASLIKFEYSSPIFGSLESGETKFRYAEQQRELLRVLEGIQSPLSRIELEIIDINDQIQAGFEDQSKRTQTLQRGLEEEKEHRRRLEILGWLSKITFEDHHSFICENRLEGTGEWLLEKPDFIKWKDSPLSSVLWLHGIAGAGKSKLASLVVDTFREQNQGDALAYFYCNYKEKERRDPENILRTIVKQLSTIESRTSLPKSLVDIYEEREESGFKSGLLKLDESKDLIVELTGGFKQTIISIDALDECEKGTRGKLLGALQHILSKSKSRVKIFVTSRDDDDIVLHLANLPNIYIRSSDNSSDINNFIETEVERCIQEKKILRGSVPHTLKGLIISTLIDGANGMFLWAHLQIINICKEKTAPAIKKALTSLPSDLTETFSDIMSKVEDQSCDSSVLAKRALMFIMCAQRPLHPNELIGALRIEPKITTWGFEDDGLTEMTILDVCQNLVVIDASETQYVLRFAHLSVQDFLVQRLDPSSGHTQFAEVCLTLLCWPIYADVNSNSQLKEIENHVLVDYSTANWAAHVRLSNTKMNNILVGLEEDFLRSIKAYNIWWGRIEEAQDSSELSNCINDIALHKHVLDRRGNILGKEHPETLMTAQKMADSLRVLEKHEEAIEVYKQVLASREEVLGKEHPDTLSTAHDMSICLDSLGRYEEALELDKQALAGREKLVGRKEHLDTLGSFHNMSISLSKLGRYEEALELYKRALAGREKLLGKEHPNTLGTAHSMSNCLINLERYEEALELYKQVLASREKVLGKEHPTTLSTAHNMSICLTNLERYEEAIELYKQVLASREKVLGKEHRNTLATLNFMAYPISMLGRYKEAIELYKQVLPIRERLLGKDHPDTLNTAGWLAHYLEKFKNNDDSKGPPQTSPSQLEDSTTTTT